MEAWKILRPSQARPAILNLTKLSQSKNKEKDKKKKKKKQEENEETPAFPITYYKHCVGHGNRCILDTCAVVCRPRRRGLAVITARSPGHLGEPVGQDGDEVDEDEMTPSHGHPNHPSFGADAVRVANG